LLTAAKKKKNLSIRSYIKKLLTFHIIAAAAGPRSSCKKTKYKLYIKKQLLTIPISALVSVFGWRRMLVTTRISRGISSCSVTGGKISAKIEE
jgi:hypothetical protein